MNISAEDEFVDILFAIDWGISFNIVGGWFEFVWTYLGLLFGFLYGL